MFLYKNLFFQYLLLFQSQSCLLESTAAIFRQSAGYVFLINFIGVIFEAGNETREKIWSDFGAEQK